MTTERLNLRLSLSLVSTALLLCSCQNSSDSSTTTQPAPTKIGYLVDSAVSGASYTCGSYGGVTGSDGSFLYNEGDTCSFAIGRLSLGGTKVPDDRYVSVGDLSGAGGSDSVSSSTLNIARLLQSLDEDDNPSNGISISTVSHNALQTSMDAKTLNETQLITLVQNTGKTLVSLSSAQSHLETTLRSISRLGSSTGSSSSSSSSGSSSGGGSGGGSSSCTASTIPAVSSSSMTSSSNGGTLSATVDCASTLYYVALPTELTAPSAAQIVAGQNADSSTSGIVSGNGAHTAATSKNTTISDSTNIKPATDMKLYIVAANALDLSKQSSVTAVSFTTTGSRAVKVLKTGQTTSYVANDDGTYQKGTARSYTRNVVNGIVTDNVTGLMWQDNTVGGTVNWATATGNTCQALNIGGYTDWRLPTETELSTLPHYGVSSPSITTAGAFANTASSNYYWSFTTYAAITTSAWGASFGFGGVSYGAKTNSYYVRCVRGN